MISSIVLLFLKKEPVLLFNFFSAAAAFEYNLLLFNASLKLIPNSVILWTENLLLPNIDTPIIVAAVRAIDLTSFFESLALIACFYRGLKEYEFPERIVREDYISNCYLTAWEKANKIYRERGEI